MADETQGLKRAGQKKSSRKSEVLADLGDHKYLNLSWYTLIAPCSFLQEVKRTQ